MKDYNTSKDYAHLWDLIHDGYRIPAWIGPHNAWLVNIRIEYDTILMNAQVIKNKKEFFVKCKGLDLEFILPMVYDEVIGNINQNPESIKS